MEKTVWNFVSYYYIGMKLRMTCDNALQSKTTRDTPTIKQIWLQ